jgi:hypothetical protein
MQQRMKHITEDQATAVQSCDQVVQHKLLYVYMLFTSH